MTLTVEVWKRDQTTPGPPSKVADITESWGQSFQVVKNDYGFSELNVQLTDPELAEIQPGRLIRFVRDGVTRQSLVVGPRKITRVAKGEDSERVMTVRGPGPLQLLNDGRVQPYNGEGWQPWTRERRWDYTNPALDVTGWTAAVELWQQGVSGNPSLTGSDILSILYDQGRFAWTPPDGFLDGGAWWIWSSNYDGTAGTAGSGDLHMPVGTSYFHRQLIVAEDMRARVIGGADDFLEVAIDGAVLFATAPAPEQAHQRARTQDVLLSAGTHTIRVKASNYERVTYIGNIAGLVLAIHEVNPATDAITDNVLVHTDDDWLALDYPADPPGFTAGQILLLELAAVQAQGFLLDIVPTFDELVDSEGTTWPIRSDITTSGGVGLAEIVRQIAETAIDTRVNHDLTWDAWVKGTYGSASGVVYAPEVNLEELEYDGDTTPTSSLLVLHQEGFTVLGDASTGRQGFLDLSSLPPAEAATRGQGVLDDMTEERWAVRFAYLQAEGAPGDVPFDDVDIFDTATIDNPAGTPTETECVAISWSQDLAGVENLTPHFGDLVLSADARREQILRRAGAGALNGRTSLASAPAGGTAQAIPAGEGGGGFQPIARTYSMPFERNPDVTDVESWPWPVTASGTLFEVNVRFLAAQGSDVDVLVNLDGTLLTTVTVPAGQVQWTQGGLATPVTKDANVVTIECADTGFYLQVTVRVS